MDISKSYTEIVPFCSDKNSVEICVDIGAPQSALQEFKFSEVAGHFCYNSSNSFVSQTSNRFIIWKINNQSIEFTENSLDRNLIGNVLKLKFQNTPILEGVSIHESGNNIYILIATVSSVYRIILPHPQNINTSNFISNNILRHKSNLSLLPSIFYNINQDNFQKYFHSHILNECYNVATNNTSFILSSCTWITSKNDAVFALSNSKSGIFVITMSPFTEGNKITTIEYKQENLMKRILNGFVPSIIRGVNEGNEIGLSLFVWANKNDYYLFVLCKDFKIRIWSYKKNECCFVYNLLDILIKHQFSHENLSIEKSFFRKSQKNNQNELVFSTFITNSDSNQFIVLKLNNQDSNFNINCLANIYSPEIDLIDFIVSENSICSLWLNDEGEIIVLSTSFTQESDSFWKKVSPSSSYLSQINLKSIFLTSREYYEDEIFYSGKFNLETFTKTFSIYNLNNDCSTLDDSNLFKSITTCVEFIIRKLASSNELSTDEYINIEEQCWEKFYSYCLQYKNIGNKPIGLFYDNKTDFLGLIKKDELIYIKVNDHVSDILLNQNPDLNSFLKKYNYDLILKNSLNYVLKILNIISQNLSDESLIDFELALLNRETIEKITDDLLESFLCIETSEKNSVKSFSINILDDFFIKVPYFESIFDLLIKSLDLKIEEINYDDLLENITNVVPQNFHHFMSSYEGINLICASIHQSVRIRFRLCRDLLILQKLLLNSFHKNNSYSTYLKKIQMHYIPQVIYQLQAYYTMVWICEKKISLNSKSCVGNNERNSILNLIGLNEYINLNFIEKNNINDLNTVKPIIYYFLQFKGLNLSKKLLLLKYKNINSMSMFKEILVLLVESVLQILWPSSNNFFLPEFLFGIDQFYILIDYVNDLDYWCEYNVSSRQFIKALSYLQLGYSDKSIKYFNSSFNKLNDELFLMKALKINFDKKEEDENEYLYINQQSTYLFYQKLIQFFELFSQTDYKIQLCNLALSKLNSFPSEESNENFFSPFYSMLFMAEMELENYDSAFNAIQINNLIEQKKNCLRQFIVCLFEKNLIEKLINYYYNDLEEDFVSILESKARSSDIAVYFKNKTSNYYEVLYCYFNKNNNFRKAASLMYEYSRRLFQELPGIESLNKQVLCLGLTLNNLRIIDKEYAWIIKPINKIQSTNKSFEVNKSILVLSKFNNSVCSSKRCHEGKSILQYEPNDSSSSFIEREIEILGIDEIKTEYYLAQARLMLLEKNYETNSIVNTYVQVEEIINLLLSNCMFDLAFKLSIQIGLPIEKIFEELANKYVYVANNGFKMDDVFKNIQNWFIENETAFLTYISMNKCSLINKMWLLINEYILKYEKPKQTVIHKCVAEKLLESRIQIPYFLKISYQKRNSAELLYLYLCYNYIEEAYYLGLELINGFLSIGTEYFDINYNVMSEEISYFPNQHIKKLLSILKEKKDNSEEFLNMYNSLNDKMDEYKNLSIKASQRIINKKLQIEIK